MGADHSRPTRRSVLKATGTALGVAAGAAGGAAAKCFEVKYRAPAYENCPPTGSRDGSLDAGTPVNIGCVDGDGTVYWYGIDEDTIGYVADSYVGPC